jgi:hypothetical protein
MRIMATHSRDEWLNATDEQLLAQCAVDTYRASGPGGQKRNKTSSAVRLRHGPSGLSVIAEESRSQHENKARAVRRLRMAIALGIREPLTRDWQPPAVFARHVTPAGRIELSQKNPAYPDCVAVVLDVVAAYEGRLRESAQRLGVSTAQLSGMITDDGKFLDAVNKLRVSAGAGMLQRD